MTGLVNPPRGNKGSWEMSALIKGWTLLNNLHKPLPCAPSRPTEQVWWRTYFTDKETGALRRQELTLKVTRLVCIEARIQSLAAQLPKLFIWFPLGSAQDRHYFWATGEKWSYQLATWGWSELTDMIWLSCAFCKISTNIKKKKKLHVKSQIPSFSESQILHSRPKFPQSNNYLKPMSNGWLPPEHTLR